jgi:hypothetical protein
MALQHLNVQRAINIWHVIKTCGKQSGIGKLTLARSQSHHHYESLSAEYADGSNSQYGKHKSVETLMIYNKGLVNLENNAVYTLN